MCEMAELPDPVDPERVATMEELKSMGMDAEAPRTLPVYFIALNLDGTDGDTVVEYHEEIECWPRSAAADGAFLYRARPGTRDELGGTRHARTTTHRALTTSMHIHNYHAGSFGLVRGRYLAPFTHLPSLSFIYTSSRACSDLLHLRARS